MNAGSQQELDVSLVATPTLHLLCVYIYQTSVPSRTVLFSMRLLSLMRWSYCFSPWRAVHGAVKQMSLISIVCRLIWCVRWSRIHILILNGPRFDGGFGHFQTDVTLAVGHVCGFLVVYSGNFQALMLPPHISLSKYCWYYLWSYVP